MYEVFDSDSVRFCVVLQCIEVDVSLEEQSPLLDHLDQVGDWTYLCHKQEDSQVVIGDESFRRTRELRSDAMKKPRRQYRTNKARG